MPGVQSARMFVLAAFACASIAAFGQSDERILDFDAAIAVQADGSAIVTETISVRANSNQIQRGIYRDLPAFRITPRTVLRDGAAEDFHTERTADGTRIYIGSADRYLAPGTYTYTIEYMWPRIVRHFDAHDEVYWNVTGTQWAFPIDHARARVTLPAAVNPEGLDAEAYTGPEGAQGGDYYASVPESGAAEYETTRRLGAREGLTIVLTFPKGLVAPPSTAERAVVAARDFSDQYGGLAAFGLVLVYYTVVWAIAGRDPAPGRIVPIDSPPDEHSPAACRYVRDMAYDGTAFSAAIVDMAHKGHLRIEQDGTQFVLVQDQAANGRLHPDEQAIADTLFAEGPEVVVSRATNNERFMAARSAAVASLKTDYALFFKRNLWYLLPGLGLSLLALYQVFPSRDQINDMELVMFMSIFVGVWSVAVSFLAWAFFSVWFAARREPDKAEGGVLLMAAIAGIFWIAEIIVMGVLAYNASLIYAVSILFVAAVHVLFAFLLRRHTAPGRELLDRIECFEQWLTDAAVHRFAAADSAEAARRFDQYLPYAMAIDREAEWTGEFETALTSASTSPEPPRYRPQWYHRRHGTMSAQPYTIGQFMTSFSQSFNEAVNTASTAPSSSSSSGGSSGSGGGGSSGGGSGGGGGGGW